jgi:hypothetical protein
MPKLRSQNHTHSTIGSLIDGFTASLTSLLEASSVERARQAVMVAFGGSAKPTGAKRGRPPGRVAAAVAPTAAARKRRKKAPIQLCPVPGCKDRAAPIFGMVCKKHKGIAKSKIRKYREARRDKKSAAA